MALPLSILMSSLMTFGNLGERYELTAIKASGISLQRIMSPLIILVVFISFGAFLFANNVLPYANLQMRSLLYDIQQQNPEFQLTPGTFNSLVNGYSIRVQDKNPKTNTLYKVQIYDHTKDQGNASVTIADSGTIKMTLDNQNLILTLYNGYSYNELQDQRIHESKRSYPHRFDTFESQYIIINLDGFSLQRTNQDLFKNHYAMMNLEQLTEKQDSLNREIKEKEDQLYLNLISGNYFKKKDTKSGFGRHSIKNPEHVRTPRDPDYPEPINVYEEEPIAHQSKIQIDTIKKAFFKQSALNDSLPLRIVNVDSIYQLLTLRDQSRVMGTALTFARTSKNVISNSVQALDFKIRYLRRFEIEWFRKFAIAFACMVFLFIGAPLGAIIRKGGLGLPLVLSVLFFIFYYILSLTGEKLVRESLMPAYQGMMIASFVFFIIGIFLTYKATTDSTMLNLDTYMNFIKKYLGQRYTIVDKLSIQNTPEETNPAKLNNIKASLFSLQEMAEQLIDWKKQNTGFSNIIFSLFALSTDATLVQFERYYNNTFRIIINNPVFHNKTLRGKVFEFPAFSNDEFIAKGWKLALKVFLSCIPPITILVVLWHLIKMQLLEMKLKKIAQLVPELVSILNIQYPNHSDENTPTVQ